MAGVLQTLRGGPGSGDADDQVRRMVARYVGAMSVPINDADAEPVFVLTRATVATADLYPRNAPRRVRIARRSVAKFTDDDVAPVSAELDAKHEFPYQLVAKMGQMGLFGLPFAEEHGGMGGDYFALCLAIEEIARVNQSLAITLEAGVSLGAMPIHRFGTEEQKREWSPQLTDGSGLAAFGLTEPEAGSDAGGTKTRAVLEDGMWTVNGGKCFITNSGTDITRLVTATAVTGTRTGKDGVEKPEISTIMIPSGTPGFTVEPAYDKVGWNSSDTHPLTFDNVKVP